MLAWIMATDAAKHTSIVVRNPAAWPRAPLLNPMIAPASIVSARRTQISLQLGNSGISIGALARNHIWNAYFESTFRGVIVLDDRVAGQQGNSSAVPALSQCEKRLANAVPVRMQSCRIGPRAK